MLPAEAAAAKATADPPAGARRSTLAALEEFREQVRVAAKRSAERRSETVLLSE